MSTATLTSAHQRDLAELTGLAQNDLALIWAEFNTATDARDGLIDVLPRLVAVYGSAAATLGADWYDEMRAAEEITGRFRAITAELPDVGRTDALARWGVTPLFSAMPDYTGALTRVSGGLQRIIANADRGSVTASSIADPRATGWQREGSGACPFCAMLIGRGAVYSQAGSTFASHDHCHCSAVPAFGGRSLPVKAYTPTNRNITDADRARVREYLASANGQPLSAKSQAPSKPSAAAKKKEAPVRTNEDKIADLRKRLRAAEVAPGNNAIDIANLKRLIAGLEA